ncbi:MAG: 2-C-methyl-D-erythritol 4-phosphate cytidylyltransferase [Betaproteobacteria bacterium]
MRYHALIPAAGESSRFASDRPKQYAPLDGKPVLMHAIERLAAAFPLHMTYVALQVGDRWYDSEIGTHPRVCALRCGGSTRAETVRNALAMLPDVATDDWIVVHDAARPCVDPASLARLQRELADDAVGGILAVPMVSALKRAGDDGRVARTEPREGLWQAQTPQMFRYGVLRDAFAQPGAGRSVDEAQAVEALGLRPRLVVGHPNNLKISYSDDLLLASAILAAMHGAKI